MATFTQWFKDGEMPVRPGVYQRVIAHLIIYSYWDGFRWYKGGTLPIYAMRIFKAGDVSLHQYLEWRGIHKCHLHR